MLLSKKPLSKFEVYRIQIELKDQIHNIQTSIWNGTDFEFLRVGEGSHQSIDYQDFQEIKSMIMDSFLEVEKER